MPPSCMQHVTTNAAYYPLLHAAMLACCFTAAATGTAGGTPVNRSKHFCAAVPFWLQKSRSHLWVDDVQPPQRDASVPLQHSVPCRHHLVHVSQDRDLLVLRYVQAG
jgi:hypothetical protein